MHIIRCYVENFGKLSNFNYEFKNGLNIISESNGFGKTTFASFIKSMFYGLENTSKRTTALTDRKKYMPWQGGNYGGNLEFEISGKKYKIERYFGKKGEEDTFKLYDLDTNLESTDYTEHIGEEIFKINKEAYERSTYIPQQKIKINMNDSLNAKLGNILESENDVNTSEKAIKNISEAIKKYKKTGGRGLIDVEKNNINIYKKKLEEIKKDEENINARKIKLKEIVDNLKENKTLKEILQGKITKVLDIKRRKAKKETYKTIIKKYESDKAKLDKVKEFFNGEIPQDEEIDILIDKCMEIEKCKIEFSNYEISNENKKELENLNSIYKNKEIDEDKIKQVISEFDENKDIINKIETIKANMGHLEKEKNILDEKILSNKKMSKIFMIISIIFIVTGITIFILVNKFIGLIISTIAIIFGLIYLLKKMNNKSLNISYEKKSKEIEEIKDELGELQNRNIRFEANIDQFIEEFSDSNEDGDKLIKLTEIKSNFNRYNDLNNNFNSILEKQFIAKNKYELLEESIKEYLKNFFASLDKPYTKLAEIIKMKKNEYNLAKIEFDNSLKEKEGYEKENNIEELDTEDVESETKEELEDNMKNIDEKISILSDEKNYLKNQIEKLETEIEEIDEIEEEIIEKKEKLDYLEKRYKILDNTKKLMEKAKEQFSSHYLSGMIESFNQYMKLINQDEINTSIDVNLDAKIDYKGSKKDIDFMSTGYKDLIYICMRFSLIKALFRDEIPFIILDDPFVNFDESKTEHALKLIKELSKDYQIIYFICHNSRG